MILDKVFLEYIDWSKGMGEKIYFIEALEDLDREKELIEVKEQYKIKLNYTFQNSLQEHA
jgi:hypothetical protein